MSPNTPHKYSIGWICALPIELAAAREMLDEEHDALETQDANDNNTYVLGRIAKHNIVIACLPAGQYGSASAAVVAKDMVRTFPNMLRVGLMVGIGGGIPSSQHDIRLGDIAVSQPQGDCGGVYQFDTGKVLTGGRLVHTGSLNAPPRSLLTALSSLRARELTDDPNFPTYMERAITRNARTRNTFGRPPADSDRLFETEYPHPQSAATCSECPSDWERERDPRQDNEPRPFYGTIATGNVFMKDSMTRDQIQKHTEALCFVTEAAGLMLDLPCIVIRGICDYADSHKNKTWQGYAAIAAAAYAKEFLQHVSHGQVSQEKLASETVSRIVDQLGEVNLRLDRAFEQQAIQEQRRRIDAHGNVEVECHQALKTSPYEIYKNRNVLLMEGTCQWAASRQEFYDWEQSDSDAVLWISADPGCGKSVFARSLVDGCLSSIVATASAVCYFFFKDNDEQNGLATALCALLHQLFKVQPHLLTHALPSYRHNGKAVLHEPNELWRIFLEAGVNAATPGVICVLDALDECRQDDRIQLLENLSDFHRQRLSCPSKSWIKFLVTSRPYRDIQDGFSHLLSSFPNVHIQGENENNLIGKEIDLVARERIQQLAETEKLSEGTRMRIEQRVLGMENRTYLWLNLAIDDIRRTLQNSLRPNEETFQTLPSSADGAYEKILARVSPKLESMVKLLFRIIIGARRPLKVAEMSLAIGVATRLQPTSFDDISISEDKLSRDIRQWCGLFVFIDADRIHLLHQTAKEFLLNSTAADISIGVGWKHCLREVDVERELTSICVDFLMLQDLPKIITRVTRGWRKTRLTDFKGSDSFESEDSEDFEDFHERIIWELFHYIIENWADHFRRSNFAASDEQTLRVLTFYLSPKLFFKYVFRTPLFDIPWLDSNHPYDANAISFAAFNGHVNILEILLDRMRRNDDIGQASEQFGLALFCAAGQSFKSAVEILLDNGASPNDIHSEHGTALQIAIKNKNREITQLLLAGGAEADIKTEWDTALCLATHYAFRDLILILLDYGANMDVSGSFFGSALQVAVHFNRYEIIELFLSRGADVNAQSGYYGNALQTACKIGNPVTVKLLLSKGAAIDAVGGWHGTALQAACSEGHKEVVLLLLDKGAEVNFVGGTWGNALQAAYRKSNWTIFHMLLDHRANIDLADNNGTTVLQIACWNGDRFGVQKLLDCGADVNSPEHGAYGTSLQAASSQGHQSLVQMLLENGAKIDMPSKRYGSALHAAASGCYLEIVNELINRGASLPDKDMVKSILRQGSSGDREAIMESIAYYFDMNLRGRHECSTLAHAAAMMNNEYLFTLLCRHGWRVPIE